MENIDYDKLQQQKTEKFVLILFSLYGFGMVAVSVAQDWADWVSFFLFANAVTGWILYIGHWRDYRSRAFLITVMMGVMLMLFGAYMEDIFQTLAIMASFAVIAGFFGICDLIGIIAVATAVLLFYHGVILKTIQFSSLAENLRIILLIANIFLEQFVVYLWVKHRNINDARADESIAALQQAERSKDDFLANVSHEIRTPINTICGMSEVVLGENDPQKIRQQVRCIQYAGRNLMSMVSDILDFSELQAGTVELEEEAYHVTSMMNDIIQMAVAKKGDKQLELIVDCDAGIPCGLYGDEKKIRRVILNIVENAIKFTDEGYVSIKVTGRREAYGMNLCITVKDTGIGMREESLEKLFTSFAQVDTRRNRSEGGIGIGLAISQALVRKMGGIITVKSRYEKGTEVRIVIPQKIWNEQPITDIAEREKYNIAVYVNMEQFKMNATRDEYTQNVAHMVEQLKVRCRICRNLAELKRREQREHFTHIFISDVEYREDRAYFDELSKEVRIICIVEPRGERRVTNQRISLVFKPFYILPIVSVLNGEMDGQCARYIEHNRGFVAPTAHVLVVDDNEMNIRVITALLEKYQIKVTEAGSGREALEKIESMDYDFVFMDHMMPEMDGVETLHRIREKVGNYYQRVPVVVLTANAIAGMREKFLKDGFADFLEKPVEVSVLERVLRRNLPVEKLIPIEGETENAASPRSLEQEDAAEKEAVSEKEAATKTGGELPGWDRDAAREERASAQVEETENKETVPEIEGIDRDTGLLYCGGEEGYRKVLENYSARGAEHLEKLWELYQNGQWDEYVIAVHGIKSAMRSIGAIRVSELAKEQEMAGKAGNISYVKEHHAELAEAYERVFTNIRRSMGADTGSEENTQMRREEKAEETTELRELDEAKRDAFTKALEEAVFGLDAEAMLKIVEELEGYSYCGKPLKKLLEPVRRKIGMADYMSALDAFEQMCARIEAGRREGGIC